MALTLIEAAKKYADDPVRSAIIEVYAMASDLLMVLPFDDIEGHALRYNQEQALPGIGFRGVNEGYTESTGIINPVTEPLVIAGGDLDVDRFIIRTAGDGQRSVQEVMKAKALAYCWTKTFFKGDSSTSPKEFDGLQARISGGQLVSAGDTAGGDALSLAKLDELIDQVANPTHLVMNKTMRRRLTAAARSASVGGNISYDVDGFGRRVAFYNDLPILIADEDNAGEQILTFSESNPGGGTAGSTSIYCISTEEGHLRGIQNGDMEVRDLGEQEAKPVVRTRIEWYSGIAIYHPKAAARLWGIKDAAVTV